MPNWCHSTLIVTGSAVEVCSWVEKGSALDKSNPDVSPQPLHMEAFFPPPPDILADYGKVIDWQVDNWGTKWDVSFLDGLDGAFSLSEGEATYRFDTAWGPPLEWLDYVAKKYPQLSFRLIYGEPGMDFGGEVVYQRGELIQDQEGSAEDFLDKEDMWF